MRTAASAACIFYEQVSRFFNRFIKKRSLKHVLLRFQNLSGPDPATFVKDFFSSLQCGKKMFSYLKCNFYFYGYLFVSSSPISLSVIVFDRISGNLTILSRSGQFPPISYCVSKQSCPFL